QIVCLGYVAERIEKTIEGTRISEAEIIDYTAAEGVDLTGCNASGMIKVGSGSKARRKSSEPGSQHKLVLAIAVAGEDLIFPGHIVIELDVEIVEVTNVAAHSAEVMQDARQVRLGEGPYVIQSGSVNLAHWDLVASK